MERDRERGLSFELDFVYATSPNAARKAVLNRAECFWRVTVSKTRRTATLRYEAAAQSRAKKLSFEDFCALNHMRDDLVALVEQASVAQNDDDVGQSDR